MPSPKKDNAKLAKHYIKALKTYPMCRICFKYGTNVKLTRYIDSPMQEAINTMIPPFLYGIKDDELPDWICDACRKAINSTKDLPKRAVFTHMMMPVPPVQHVPVGQQIKNDLAALEGTSRKRPRAVDMATVVPNVVGQKLAQQRHREQLEANRIRLSFTSCVLTPPRKDVAGEGPLDDAAEMDLLFDNKRVPDILTETISSDGDLMSSTRCSAGRAQSEDDFPIILLDPSHPCTRCPLLFATTQQVGWHTRIHSSRGQLQCRYCQAKFERVVSYLRHLQRLHADLRRTQCFLCDDHFSLPSNFKTVHEQYHEFTRMKYACSFCPLIFNRYKKLRVHRQLMHNDWRLMCRDGREAQNNNEQAEVVADE